MNCDDTWVPFDYRPFWRSVYAAAYPRIDTSAFPERERESIEHAHRVAKMAADRACGLLKPLDWPEKKT